MQFLSLNSIFYLLVAPRPYVSVIFATPGLLCIVSMSTLHSASSWSKSKRCMHLAFLLTGPPALLYLLCKKYQFFLSVYTLLMFPDINHRPSGCNQLTVLHLIHERTALNRVSLLKRSHHQWVTFHPTNVYNRGTRANLCIGRRFLEKKHSALLQHNCNRSVRFLIRQHHRVGQSHPLMLIKLWARQL